MRKVKKAGALAMGLCMAVALLSGTASALEGQADSFWGNIPENQHFAFVDSRYYDGTDYVKVFNAGIYAGSPGEYYTNGDWTDMSTVYRREDYYKNEEFIEFSNTGQVGDPKPAGYPTNDVGGDADGQLPSYNAGTYTTLSWTNFEMYGRYWFNNYGIDSIINVPRVATYVEIWKVAPELTLSIDKNEVDRGDTFTLTLAVKNHFGNMDGLPAENEVIFSADNATATSTVVKTDNTYTQTFRATEDTGVDAVNIRAGVLDTATNYKEGYETLALPLAEVHGVSYAFVSGSEGKELPAEIMQLLPQDPKLYEAHTTVAALQPGKTQVNTDTGVWNFSGYDADSKIADADITFIGTWTYTHTAPEDKPAPSEPEQPAGPKEDPASKTTDIPQTGDGSAPALWLALFVLACGSMAAVTVYCKKRRAH